MTLQCIAIQSKITNLQQACHLLFRIFVESWTIKLLKNGFVSKALQFQAIKSKCSQLISVISNLINQKIHLTHLKDHLAWIFIFYSFYCKHADKMCGGKRSAIELALHSPAALVKTKGISIFPCSFGHRHFLHATTWAISDGSNYAKWDRQTAELYVCTCTYIYVPYTYMYIGQ